MRVGRKYLVKDMEVPLDARLMAHSSFLKQVIVDLSRVNLA